MVLIFSFLFVQIVWSVRANVPIIDISPLLETSQDSNTNHDALMNCSIHINQALVYPGVFKIYGYESIFDSFYKTNLIQTSKDLFDLPIDIKNEIKMNISDPVHGLRGYIPFAQESGLISSTFEPKEGFSYGFDHDTSKSNYMRNKWPDVNIFDINHIANLKIFYMKQATLTTKILQSIVNLWESSLEIEDVKDLKSYMDTIDGREISVMRLFHYFHSNDERVKDVKSKNPNLEILGSSPHSDWGLLTLILQDQTGGLQFYDSKFGNWINVEADDNHLIVNGGDYLSLISKNKYHSPIHRVKCSAAKERYSFVYFHYPGPNSKFPSVDIHEESNIKRQSVIHNSLIGNDGEISDVEETFGNYILKKWRGVNKI